MSCCKCCGPILENNFEFELGDDIFISGYEPKVVIPLEPLTDIALLELKIICEYLWIISELEKGNAPDLDFLLEEISAVDLESIIDNREFVILYYLNNKL